MVNAWIVGMTLVAVIGQAEGRAVGARVIARSAATTLKVGPTM